MNCKSGAPRRGERRIDVGAITGPLPRARVPVSVTIHVGGARVTTQTAWVSLSDLRRVMNEYEGCLRAFQDGSPEAFRAFLRTCQEKYWLLGYCTSALNAVALTFHQYRQRSSGGRLFYGQTNDMLRQMSVALDRRRERPSSF